MLKNKTKISWIRRLFMSWKRICEYCYQNVLSAQIQTLTQKYETQKTLVHKLNAELDAMQKTCHQLKLEKASLYNTITQNNQSLVLKEEAIVALKKEKRAAVVAKNISVAKSQTKKPADLSSMKLFEENVQTPQNMAVKTKLDLMLKKFNIDSNLWKTNLQVEDEKIGFAFWSGYDDQKWLPVVSQDIKCQVHQQPAVDLCQKCTKVMISEVKKFAKSLDKNNTTKYGILVILNDVFYYELWRYKADLFYQILQDDKVYILSPFIFTRFAFCISEIFQLKIRITHEEEMFDKLVELIDNIVHYGDNLRDAYLDSGYLSNLNI